MNIRKKRLIPGIAEDFEENFEQFWELKKDDYIGRDEDPEVVKIQIWNQKVKWLNRMSRLMRNVIPRHQETCLVETKQNYSSG